MLCCNRCRKDLQIGSSFKTACRHVFCEACANQSFSSDCICPICKQRLQSQDVSEFLVGINPAVPVQENIFQAAFQDASTSAVLENTSKILHAVSELIKFVNSQVSDQSEAAAEDLIRLEQTIEQNRNESTKALYEMREQDILMSQQVRILEQKAAAKDEELDTLKEAYRTKLKKSEAWEKAYYNIKEQIGGSALSLPQDMNPQLADENNEQVVSGAPNVGNGYALTNFEADNDNSYRRGGETRKRHCVYTKETNITKTIGRPMTRVGAEPHKQWFPGDSSLYFQRNLATGARAESVGAYCNEGNLNQDLQREKQYRQLDRASRRDVEPENRVTQRQTNRRQGDIGDTQRGGLAGETNMKFPPQSGKSFQQLQTARRPPEHCFVPSVPSSSRQANTSSFFDQQVLTSGGDNAGKYGARW